jgi:hypothetical protein
VNRRSVLESKESTLTIPDRFAPSYLAKPPKQWIPRIHAKYTQLVDKRARVYVLVSIWVVFWSIVHLYFVAGVFPNALNWLTYYVANYHSGFVRRGLAGELIRMFPDSHYLTGAYAAMWASTVAWLIALMWLIITTAARFERRMMLALVLPVLPFSFTYAVYSPHPELFGMAALLVFSMSLTRIRTPRPRMIASALYGIAIAVLALMHEAIPLEFGLGAILAIVVLSRDATHAAQRICAVLAVGPGIVSVLLIAGLGRRDIAGQLCTQVPHGMVDNPWAVSTTPQKALNYMLGHVESQSDYHDWVCHRMIPIFDATVTDGIRAVGQWGFVPLICSFILGLLYFFGTTWAIRYFSGVPVRAFFNKLRDNLVLPALGLVLLVPLFVVAVDWTRWWILTTFDVAIVYTLFAISRPEIERVPSRRTLLVFVWFVMVLAVLPTGAANNVGTYQVVAPSGVASSAAGLTTVAV